MPNPMPLPNPQPTPILPPMPQPIPLATLLACKRDYIHGKFPSVPTAAKAHGINPESLKNRAKRENWTTLRGNYIAKQDAKLSDPDAQDVPQQPPANPQNPQPLAVLDQQIDALNRLFTDEVTKPNPDPLALDRLQSALSRASERRRILLNIPLPGSHRPSRKPSRPVMAWEEPVIVEPSLPKLPPGT